MLRLTQLYYQTEEKRIASFISVQRTLSSSLQIS